MEFDGETEVSLGQRALVPSDGSLALRWHGDLQTNGHLAVLTVDRAVVLETEVESTVRLELWTNDPQEPDVVWVAIA